MRHPFRCFKHGANGSALAPGGAWLPYLIRNRLRSARPSRKNRLRPRMVWVAYTISEAAVRVLISSTRNVRLRPRNPKTFDTLRAKD